MTMSDAMRMLGVDTTTALAAWLGVDRRSVAEWSWVRIPLNRSREVLALAAKMDLDAGDTTGCLELLEESDTGERVPPVPRSRRDVLSRAGAYELFDYHELFNHQMTLVEAIGVHRRTQYHWDVDRIPLRRSREALAVAAKWALEAGNTTRCLELIDRVEAPSS